MERNLAAYYTKIQKQSSSNNVNVKGKDITNPADITNAFNNFFIGIGPNPSKTIPD